MGLFCRLAASSALAKLSNQQICIAIGPLLSRVSSYYFSAGSFAPKHNHPRGEDKAWKQPGAAFACLSEKLFRRGKIVDKITKSILRRMAASFQGINNFAEYRGLHVR